MQIDYELFCKQHPYRVVGPEDMPERRFTTLCCAARTAFSAGPRFHVECGAFRADFDECRQLTADADLEAERAEYWDRISGARL